MNAANRIVWQCPEKLDQLSGQSLFAQVSQHKIAARSLLVLDFSMTREINTHGGAWVIEAANYVHARKGHLVCTGQQGGVAEFLQMIRPAFAMIAEPAAAGPDGFTRLVETILAGLAEARAFLAFLLDTIYWTVIGPFEGHGFRWGAFVEEIHEMGVRALKISLLMNFLLGLIVAMLAAAQLDLFGASIYVADLVVVAFGRELAAVMTAVVVSARTGAAIAAELATMKVQEEIDALRGMGLHIGQFLVAPKLLALLVVLPILTGLGMLAGIGGGTVWALLVLDFRPEVWFAQTLNAAAFGDVFQGLFKSIFFAVAIVMIGCHNGLRVSAGARGVGLMTTRAVVMDIFFIIVIDMLFAGAFYYLL